MPPRHDHLTYREWRERGKSAVGAFFRMVPYQYIWAVVVLLVVLAWMGVVSIKDLEL